MHKKLLTFILCLTLSSFFGTAFGQTVVITSSTSDTICSGAMVTFSATATGGIHYRWLKNSLPVGVDSTHYSTAALANGDVITCELLSAPAGSILALSGPIVMTVQHMPLVAPITGTDTVCYLATTTLTDATAGGAWNTADPFIASVSSAGIVTGVYPGLDTITYTLTNTCGTASAVAPVFVNAAPILGPITGPNVLCMGGTATYTDSPATGTWNVSNPGVATISSTGTLSAHTYGQDTVYYSLTNACGTSTRRRLVSVQPAPVVTPIAGSTAVCQNDTIHLRDGFQGGNWRSSNNMIANVTGGGAGGNVGVVHGNGGGTVTITYVVRNACGADSATAVVTVNPVPFIFPIAGRDSICPGTTQSLFEFTPGGTWSSLNNTIATVDSFGNVSGIAAGVDTIYYSLSNDCGNARQAIPMSVYCPHNVGVAVVTAPAEITISPNPVHDLLTIQGADAALVQVVNMLGQTVNTAKGTNTVAISNLPEGLYIVTVYDGNGTVIARRQIVKN